MSSLFGASTGQGIHCMQEWLHVGGSGCVNHISGQAPCSGGADQQKSDSIIFMIALFLFCLCEKEHEIGGGAGRSCGRERHDQNILYEIPPICVLACVYACA